MKLLILILGSAFFAISGAYAEKTTMSSSRLSILSGDKDKSYDTKSQWDQRYNKRSYVYGKLPAKFLAENFDYLANSTTILDMGMGEGRNAVFLAQKGHQVTGIDISSVAIKKARQLAKENGVRINTVVGTLNKYAIPNESYDAIICFYYVDRELVEKIYSWLKPGGILIYEAHTLNEYERLASKKESKEYYLKPQELIEMFPKMKVLKYEEPLHEPFFRASIILKK